MEYQPGEEILEGEEPFSHIIKSQFRSEFCDWCIKKGDPNEEVILKKCTACKEVSYCNRDCQRKAFSAYHKQECSKLKTIPQGNLLKGIDNKTVRTEKSKRLHPLFTY